MVKIRLRRVGAKKQPHYRVVVADQKSPRDGRFIETIGHYNPRTEPPTIEIDAQRALYWLSVGAQPSEAVKRMLDKLGIMARFAAYKRGEVTLEAPMEELVEEAVQVEAEEAEPAEDEEPAEEAEGAEAEVEEPAEESEAVETEEEEPTEEIEAAEAEDEEPAEEAEPAETEKAEPAEEEEAEPTEEEEADNDVDDDQSAEDDE
jgi:small subunit ribosomal protein S16